MLRARQGQALLDPRHFVLKLTCLAGQRVYVGGRQAREVPFEQKAQGTLHKRLLCQVGKQLRAQLGLVRQ